MQPIAIVGVIVAAIVGWTAYGMGKDAGYIDGLAEGQTQGKAIAQAQCDKANEQAGREAIEQLLRLQAEQAEQERKANEAIKEREREAQLEREDIDRRIAALRERLRVAEARAANRVRDAAGRSGVPEATGATSGRPEPTTAGAGLLPRDGDPTALEIDLAEAGERVAGQFRSCYRYVLQIRG